jgi:hypothetical protein
MIAKRSRRRPRIHDRKRMRCKGDDNRRQPTLRGNLLQINEDFTVAEMHPIERADGEHRSPQQARKRVFTHREIRLWVAKRHRPATQSRRGARRRR